MIDNEIKIMKNKNDQNRNDVFTIKPISYLLVNGKIKPNYIRDAISKIDDQYNFLEENVLLKEEEKVPEV